MSEWSHEQIEEISPQVRERAVRMMQEQRGEYPSLWAAVESIASKTGCERNWDTHNLVANARLHHGCPEPTIEAGSDR